MSRVKIIKDTTLVPVNVNTNGTTRTNFSPENAHSFLNTKIDKIDKEINRINSMVNDINSVLDNHEVRITENRNELDNRLSEQEAYDILVGNN